MRVAQVAVYKFDELNEKAKKRAIEKAREHANETFDAQQYFDMFRTILKEEFGIVVDGSVNFSLNYCQGDGVAFYGLVDADVLHAKHPNLGVKNCYIKIVSINPRYNHWNSMRVEVETPELDESRSLKLETQLLSLIQDASRTLEKRGYDWLEADTSDETLRENILANDDEYDVNGNLWTKGEIA